MPRFYVTYILKGTKIRTTLNSYSTKRQAQRQIMSIKKSKSFRKNIGTNPKIKVF